MVDEVGFITDTRLRVCYAYLMRFIMDCNFTLCCHKDYRGMELVFHDPTFSWPRQDLAALRIIAETCMSKSGEAAFLHAGRVWGFNGVVLSRKNARAVISLSRQSLSLEDASGYLRRRYSMSALLCLRFKLSDLLRREGIPSLFAPHAM